MGNDVFDDVGTIAQVYTFLFSSGSSEYDFLRIETLFSIEKCSKSYKDLSI